MSRKSQFVIIDGHELDDASINIYTNTKAAFEHCKVNFNYTLSYATFLRYFQKSNTYKINDGSLSVLVTAVTPKTAFVKME